MPQTPKANPDDVLARLLRELREARGLTQAALAEALELEQTDVSKVERRARRLDVLTLRGWVMTLGTTLPAFAAELESRLEGLQVLHRRPRRRATPKE